MTTQSRSKLALWILLAVLIIAGLFAGSAFYAVKSVMHAADKGGDYFVDAGNVAVMQVHGVIMDPDETLKKIEELDDKDAIKAVVLRINSPGGAVGPSQEIFSALKRLKESKKLVCSFGDLAASGAYYIAAACDKIYANPGTLTGSIGVIMHFMNLKNLYNWAKVQPETIKAGHFKDIGSESRDMTPEERKLLQTMLDQVHDQFKKAVMEGRKLKPAVVDAYADGRVFSGEEAKRLGFVDELGGEFEAIEAAGQLAGIKGHPQVVREVEEHRPNWPAFLDSDGRYGGGGILGRLLSAFLPREFSTALSTAVDPPLRPGVPYFLPAHMFGGSSASSR